MFKERVNKINDIDLTKWNSLEYQDLITDSLWIFNKRDNAGEHKDGINYPGNFCPQIVNQLLRRFTKERNWVLDPMVGGGTTLIEASKLHRYAIGIDLDTSYLKQNLDGNKYNYHQGDATLYETYEKFPYNFFDFIICHPPYHNIIKYSDKKEDLSNMKDVDDFVDLFSKVIYLCNMYLKTNKYLAVVMSDLYSKEEYIPLAFKVMESISTLHYFSHIDRSFYTPFIESDNKEYTKFQLKSIIVKNFGETKGKKNQQNLWRYRALANGLYTFKHEYILLFKKVPLTKKEIKNII